MIQKLKNPNLPSGRVYEVIIGEKYAETISALGKMGIGCLTTTCCTNVRSGLTDHADMQFCPVDEETVFLSENQSHLKKQLISRGYQVFGTEKALLQTYPADVLLNAAVFGKTVICNPKTIDDNLLKYFEQALFHIISVKQGYSKCSVAIVSDEAIITDDEAIGHSAAENGFEVLIVSKGSVYLENHDYGFIGGCCGLIAKDKLAFNGHIQYHADSKSISQFVSKHHVDIVNLFDRPLEDIGSIIPIREYAPDKI